jgi:hypothetical protein
LQINFQKEVREMLVSVRGMKGNIIFKRNGEVWLNRKPEESLLIAKADREEISEGTWGWAVHSLFSREPHGKVKAQAKTRQRAFEKWLELYNQGWTKEG